MKREIKFRAWNDMIPAMVFFGLGENYIDVYDSLSDKFTVDITSKDVEVMQYTGLKDKNGKEIYEGDIIVYPCNDCEGVTHRDTYEVIYKAPMFKIKAIKSYIWKSGADIYLNDSVEVIGNIYENPELL